MEVRIDKVADAVLITWADRKPGSSHVVEFPNGKTARVLLGKDGDIAGLEVLGWSRRASKPFEVHVMLDDAPTQVTLPDDAFSRALDGHGTKATVGDGRPLNDGRPMLPMSEVAQRTGLDRSWLTREASIGRLKAKKIGREWWTTEESVAAYKEQRAVARKL